jgi:carboxymethylenebutenolidase
MFDTGGAIQMSESGKGVTLTLQTDTGVPFQVYASGPDDAARGVLVMHEWWGMRPHNMAVADRFAAAGYRALLVDLYDGQTTDDTAEAGRWMREMDQLEADAKLLASLEALRARGRKLATYGCSMGGKQSMCATLLEPESIDATVVAYCRMETDVDNLSSLKGPVLAIYASQESTWPAKQESFEAAMAEAGKTTEAAVYDAGHGFTNPTSPHYDETAAEDAWRVTIDFLGRHLDSAGVGTAAGDRT